MSFVATRRQWTSALRAFRELTRARWITYLAVALPLLALTLVATTTGSMTSFVWVPVSAVMLGWTLPTVLAPWFTPWRFKRALGVGEPVTYRFTPEEITRISPRRTETVPWSRVGALAMRDGILALLTTRQRSLLWVPVEHVHPTSLSTILAWAEQVDADTVRVTEAVRREQPVPNREAVDAVPATGLPAVPQVTVEQVTAEAVEASAAVTQEVATLLLKRLSGSRRGPQVILWILLAAGVALNIMLMASGRESVTEMVPLLALFLALALVAFGMPVLLRRVEAARFARRLGGEWRFRFTPSDLSVTSAQGAWTAPWSQADRIWVRDGVLAIRLTHPRRITGLPVSALNSLDLQRVLSWAAAKGVRIDGDS